MKCRDGKFLLMADSSGVHFGKFAEMLGRPDLANLLKADRATYEKGFADIRAIFLTKDRDDAKQALVEAFVSFGGRIGALLLAEGIERRADLAILTALGVDLGQGFLIGKPALEPAEPRPIDSLRMDATRHALTTRVRAANPRHHSRASAAAKG